jgi:hypothetical protein
MEARHVAGSGEAFRARLGTAACASPESGPWPSCTTRASRGMCRLGGGRTRAATAPALPRRGPRAGSPSSPAGLGTRPCGPVHASARATRLCTRLVSAGHVARPAFVTSAATRTRPRGGATGGASSRTSPRFRGGGASGVTANVVAVGRRGRSRHASRRPRGEARTPRRRRNAPLRDPRPRPTPCARPGSAARDCTTTQRAPVRRVSAAAPPLPAAPPRGSDERIRRRREPL